MSPASKKKKKPSRKSVPHAARSILPAVKSIPDTKLKNTDQGSADLPRPQGFWVFPVLYLCLLFPSAGIALGVVYACQSQDKNRHFGWLCLGIGLLGALLKLAVTFGDDQGGESLIQPYY